MHNQGIDAFLKLIENLLEEAYASVKNLCLTKCKGGWAYIIDERSKFREHRAIGTPLEHREESPVWHKDCEEAASCLFKDGEHISLKEACGLSEYKDTGGIRIKSLGVIIVFSGLTPELSDAVCAYTAVHLGRRLGYNPETLVPREWWHIRRLSNNPHMNEYGHINAKAA